MRITNETEYQIEKDIPIPPVSGSSKWGFHEMQVGDSFIAPGEQATVNQCAAYGAAKAYQRRHPGVLFSGRKVGPNQILIGRVE